jgi:hypothetical protein
VSAASITLSQSKSVNREQRTDLTFSGLRVGRFSLTIYPVTSPIFATNKMPRPISGKAFHTRDKSARTRSEVVIFWQEQQLRARQKRNAPTQRFGRSELTQ